MIDINSEAEKSLIKTGFTLVFHHPKKETPLPCVSFYNLTERPDFTTDNTEAIQAGWVQVDVWSYNAAECGSMAVKINEVLNADGWNRELSMDIPEDNSEIFRKTIRFSKHFIL